MLIQTVIAASAILLSPALGLAAEPLLIHIDGQAVQAQMQTHIIQTSLGPARVSTWNWHSPNGSESIEIETSTGSAPPSLAPQQMRALQAQMLVIQSHMQQLEQMAWNRSLALPEPFVVLFAQPDGLLQEGPRPERTATRKAPTCLPHVPSVKT